MYIRKDKQTFVREGILYVQKRVKGKGRKTKKKQENLYRFGNGEKILFSYSQKRKMDRKSHVESIACTRKAGENYWDMWDRGYPNRTRIRAYFTYLRI